MIPIICANNAKTIVARIQEYLQDEGIIKGMHVVDFNDQQVVILISNEEPIDERTARVWWQGYTSALAG